MGRITHHVSRIRASVDWRQGFALGFELEDGGGQSVKNGMGIVLPLGLGDDFTLVIGEGKLDKRFVGDAGAERQGESGKVVVDEEGEEGLGRGRVKPPLIPLFPHSPAYQPDPYLPRPRNGDNPPTPQSLKCVELKRGRIPTLSFT